MRFRKLELINFKSHVNTTIDFNDGISLIIGENGAGKSSIFEAITFALFTESEINNKDLVRTNKGSNEKIAMEVKLTFDADGNEYRVERKVTKKNDKATSTAKLYSIENGTEDIIAQKVTEVNKEIEQITSMDSQTYLNAIHIRQGEISKLIDERPADRKKLISQLLRIDDLEKAYDRMPDVIKEFEFKNGLIKGKLVNEDQLKCELEDLNKNQNIIVEKTAQLTSNLEELKKDNEVKASEKVKLDEQKTKLNNLKLKKESEEKQLELLNDNKNDLTKKYEEILNNEKVMVTLKPFCDKLNIYNDFKEYYLKFNNLKKDETQLRETLEKIAEYKETISTEQENYDKYVELDKELNEKNLEKTKLASDVTRIDELKTKKQSKQKDIEKNTELLKKLYGDCESALSEYCDEFDMKTKSLEEIEEFIESLKNSVKNEITQIDEKILEKNNEVGGLKQEIKSSEKPLAEIRKVEGKCPTCQSDIDENQKNQLINKYEVIISDDVKKINEVKQLINELNDNKGLKNNELSNLESIKNNITQHKHIPENIETTTNELKTIDVELADLITKKEKLDELTDSIETEITELKSLKTSFDKFSEAQTLLNNQKDEEELKKQSSEISNEIAEIEKQMTTLIEKDSNLSFEITDDELNKQIDDFTDKNNKYNNLAGTVKYKEEQEAKIKENDENIKNKESEIELIQKNIESCPFDEELYEKLKNELEEITNKIQELTTNIAVNHEKLEGFEKEIREITVKIEENKKYLAEYEATNDYIDLLNDFREHYGKNGIQKDLRTQAKPIIQSYTSDFFDKFNFNYSDLLLSDEYEITIIGPEGDINIDMVSGGEKIAIALSLRLAITQAMSKGNIETILLDEPTIHLDSFRRQELINVLRSMKIIPQMIIVTHDSELETAADTLIKIEKEDGISKVIDG